MIFQWVHILAIFWLCTGLISFVIIFIDINFFRQPSMKIMRIAWPINALYLSIIGLIAYFWFGRPKLKNHMSMDYEMHMKHKMPMDHDMHMNSSKKKITWKGIFTVSTHCGSGCTLADIIGEFAIIFFPVTIFGSAIFGSWGLDLILALALGIYFQYLPGREMGLSPIAALKKAIHADVFSVISWQVGMYIWMSLVFFVFFTPDISRYGAIYWFMMQIAMVFGFLTACPVNWLLVKKGIKHIM